MTPPIKPYIFRDRGHWCVQWYVGRRRRFVRCLGGFPQACRMAATAHRWQTGREA